MNYDKILKANYIYKQNEENDFKNAIYIYTLLYIFIFMGEPIIELKSFVNNLLKGQTKNNP